MTFTTDLVVQGQNRQVRVFSLRGCHLLAMFSKTPVAKEFRRWVLLKDGYLLNNINFSSDSSGLIF